MVSRRVYQKCLTEKCLTEKKTICATWRDISSNYCHQTELLKQKVPFFCIPEYLLISIRSGPPSQLSRGK